LLHRRLFIYIKNLAFLLLKIFLLGMKLKMSLHILVSIFPVGDVEICKENKHILVIKISDCFKIKILQFGDTMLDYFIKPKLEETITENKMSLFKRPSQRVRCPPPSSGG